MGATRLPHAAFCSGLPLPLRALGTTHARARAHVHGHKDARHSCVPRGKKNGGEKETKRERESRTGFRRKETTFRRTIVVTDHSWRADRRSGRCCCCCCASAAQRFTCTSCVFKRRESERSAHAVRCNQGLRLRPAAYTSVALTGKVSVFRCSVASCFFFIDKRNK